MNPVRILLCIWAYRDLLSQFARREVASRYKGSYLGLFWSLIQPVLMLCIYTFVFGVIFRSRWPGVAEQGIAGYAVTLFCGVAAFNLLNESLGRSPGIIKENANLVKKVIFPVEILPVSLICSAIYHGSICFLILIATNLLVNMSLHYTIIMLPLVILPLILLLMGISWILAGLGVFLPDVQAIVSLLTTMWMFLSPVFYSTTMLPAKAQFLMQFNPMAFVVDNIRRVVMWGQWPEWGALGIWMIFGIAVMSLGYAAFMWGKDNYADVI